LAPVRQVLQGIELVITNLSNSEQKKGVSLAIVFARELAELMGGNPSRLYKWGKDLGLPVPRARQTFFSHMKSDEWKMESEQESSETCRLGSYPLNCQLRVRVVSLETQFRRDIPAGKKRQLIILLGYEVCSHFIHFRVYRGDDVEVGEHEKVHGIEGCEVLPVATVAAFVKECGQMVGLPLQRVLLTQNLMDFQPVENGQSFLSLTTGEVVTRKRQEEAGDNEVLCSFGSKAPYKMLKGNHPFITWCSTTNATKLTADLSELAKRHNIATALPRLEVARQVFESLLKKSYDAAEARHTSSMWSTPLPRFLERMLKHEYALRDFSLHEVRFYKRRYERFTQHPGDFASKDS